MKVSRCTTALPFSTTSFFCAVRPERIIEINLILPTVSGRTFSAIKNDLHPTTVKYVLSKLVLRCHNSLSAAEAGLLGIPIKMKMIKSEKETRKRRVRCRSRLFDVNVRKSSVKTINKVTNNSNIFNLVSSLQ